MSPSPLCRLTDPQCPRWRIPAPHSSRYLATLTRRRGTWTQSPRAQRIRRQRRARSLSRGRDDSRLVDIRRLADLPLSREASDGCKGWRWSLAQSWVGYKSMLRLLYSKPGGVNPIFKTYYSLPIIENTVDWGAKPVAGYRGSFRTTVTLLSRHDTFFITQNPDFSKYGRALLNFFSLGWT